VGSIEKMVMFLSKYSLDRNNTIASLFRIQYTPDFLKAEYYGLRNTIFWVTKDLASAFEKLLGRKISWDNRSYGKWRVGGAVNLLGV
jgi:hypothetical protein